MATRTISNAGGLYSATTSWAEGVVPTSADDVVATATSGNLTINTTCRCRSIDLTNYVGTLTHNNNSLLEVGTTTAGPGNLALKFPAGMTYTLGAGGNLQYIDFVSTSATQQTVDFGGKTVGPIHFNGTSGSWLMQSAITTNSFGSVSVTRGTFNSGGLAINTGRFITVGSNVRVVTVTNSTITCTATNVNSWETGSDTVASSNLTINASGSSITVNGAGASFQGGSKSYGSVTLSNTTGTTYLKGSNTYVNLTFTATVSDQEFNIFTSTTHTVTGTLTFNGISNAVRAHTRTAGDVGAFTFALGATGTVTANYFDFYNTNFTGTNTPVTGTALGDMGGNSGVTTATPKTVYWVGNDGSISDAANHWASTSGGTPGAANFPLPQDTMVWDANSTTSDGRTITFDRIWKGTFDFTNAAHTISIPGGFFIPFGDWKWSTKVTITGGSNVYFFGNGVQNIHPNGASFTNQLFNIIRETQTIRFQGNVDIPTYWISHVAGTLDCNGYNLSTVLYTMNSTRTRTLQCANSDWTLTQTDGDVINLEGTGQTLTGLSSLDLFVTGGGVGQKHVKLNGNTINSITISGGGAGQVNIWNSNTFGSFTITGPKTVDFNAGGTQTIIGNFTLNASSGNVITLRSTTAGAAATLFKNSGRVDGNYLSLRDITVSGGASFYAGPNSTVVSNVTGWRYHHAPQMMLSMFSAA